MTIRLVFNVLAVCGTATLAGVLLAIGLMLGPFWQSLPPADFLNWFAQHSHLVARTIPFCLGPALVGLAGSLWLGWSDAPQRLLWGAALACIAGLLVLTIAVNAPMNGRFVSGSVPVDQVPAMLRTWLTSHSVRIALTLTASVLGVVAVSR